MVYNIADQLTLWPGMHSYTYYGDGSLKEVKDAEGATIASYTYTPEGLVSTESLIEKTITYKWDADDHRIQRGNGANQISYVYDIASVIPAVIQEVDCNGITEYVREPDGTLLCRKANTLSYYHFDALGSTRILTGIDGLITNAYSYDAWGALIAQSSYLNSVNQPFKYGGRLGYYTPLEDSAFGALLLGVRLYVPSIGRFTQLDKIARSNESRYAYCHNVPMSATDPTGYWPWDWFKPKPLKPEDVLRCAADASANCAGKKDFSECWAEEFTKCIGNKRVRQCKEFFCILYPSTQLS